MFQTEAVDKSKIQFMLSNFFFSEKFAFCETIWTNIVEPDTPQMIIRRISCCIPKATNTHSEYVILIAFPLQQWLNERASMLCYTFTACFCLFFEIRK